VTLKTLLVAAALVLLPAMVLVEEEITAVVTGYKYRELDKTARAFYVMGVVEGMQFEAAHVKFEPDLVVLRGCVGGRTGGQLMAIVDTSTRRRTRSSGTSR
jgi:hypothetical protein